MLPYRNNFDPPSDDRWRRRGRTLLSPLLWLAVGAFIIFFLLMLWLMPLSPAVNPLVWALRLIGIRLGPINPATDWIYVPAGFGAVLPIALAVLSMFALSRAMAVYRRRAALAVLGHLASAVHLRVPLPPYLRAAAGGERPLLARRLRRLADHLAGGRPVGAALDDAAGELPPLVIDRIAAAERSFALDGALGTLLRRERDRAAAPRHATASRQYAVLLVTVLLTVVWMVMVFVIPKYAQIFADFRVKLPWPTQWLIDAARWTVAVPVFDSPIVLLLLLVFLVPFLIVLAGTVMVRATRGLFVSRPGRRWTAPLADRVVWLMPFFGRMTRDKHAAAACEALSESLLAGRPLPEAIALSTLPSLNVVLKRRMKRWQADVEAGAAPAAAARAAKLPCVWCDALAGQQTDPAAAIAFAARVYAAAWHRRAVLLDAVTPLLFTGVMAVFVGFVALSLFTPIVALIDAMSPGRMR